VTETVCLANSCPKDGNRHHDSSQITGKIVHLSLSVSVRASIVVAFVAFETFGFDLESDALFGSLAIVSIEHASLGCWRTIRPLLVIAAFVVVNFGNFVVGLEVF